MLQGESDLGDRVTSTTVIVTVASIASTEMILHVPVSLLYPSDAKALAQAAHPPGQGPSQHLPSTSQQETALPSPTMEAHTVGIPTNRRPSTQ